jgi:hypothetical protein
VIAIAFFSLKTKTIWSFVRVLDMRHLRALGDIETQTRSIKRVKRFDAKIIFYDCNPNTVVF